MEDKKSENYLELFTVLIVFTLIMKEPFGDNFPKSELYKCDTLQFYKCFFIELTRGLLFSYILEKKLFSVLFTSGTGFLVLKTMLRLKSFIPTLRDVLQSLFFVIATKQNKIQVALVIWGFFIIDFAYVRMKLLNFRGASPNIPWLEVS